MANFIRDVRDAIDEIDATPFGKLGKLFDAMSTNAQRALNERDDLVKALDGLVLVCGRTGNAFEDFEEQAKVYNRETGGMRPGKDVSAASGDDGDFETRRLKYAAWVQSKIAAGRALVPSPQVTER